MQISSLEPQEPPKNLLIADEEIQAQSSSLARVTQQSGGARIGTLVVLHKRFHEANRSAEKGAVVTWGQAAVLRGNLEEPGGRFFSFAKVPQ